MARKIASYGDFFLSDAFGTSHRRNSSSMVDLPMVMGHGCCGPLIERELQAFSKIIDRTPRPFVTIIGGVKVTEKMYIVENLLSRIQYLIVGGAMAHALLKAAGYQIGNSFHESGQSFEDLYGTKRNIDEFARNFLAKAKTFNVNVLLPVDHICHTSCEATSQPVITENANVPKHLIALDIGPRTIAKYKECISRSRAAIWTGPMGVYEIPMYSTGSFAIAKELGDGTDDRGLLSIICGAATADCASRCGHASRITHISRNGGAGIGLLGGRCLPGIDVLDDKENTII